MSSEGHSELTRLLNSSKADAPCDVDQLFATVYQELRELADRFFAREPSANTLQPTAHNLAPQATFCGVGDAAGFRRFRPEEILAGRYRILGPLGRGGMGDVYRADELRLGQMLARQVA